MIGIVVKKGERGEVSMTRSFASERESQEIAEFANSVSARTGGKVPMTNRDEILNQVKFGAVIARDMSDDSIVAYNGAEIIGRQGGKSIVELKPGMVSDDFVGRSLNGDSKAILVESIRDRYPDVIILSVKKAQNSEKIESMKELGFVSCREADTIENYRNDGFMKQLGVSDGFWNRAGTTHQSEKVWIGMQTEDTYNAYINGIDKPKETQSSLLEQSSRFLLAQMIRDSSEELGSALRA